MGDVVLAGDGAGQRAVVGTRQRARHRHARHQVLREIEAEARTRQHVGVATGVMHRVVVAEVGRRHLRARQVEVDGLPRAHQTHADIAAPLVARQIGHCIDGRGLLVDGELSRPIGLRRLTMGLDEGLYRRGVLKPHRREEPRAGAETAPEVGGVLRAVPRCCAGAVDGAAEAAAAVVRVVHLAQMVGEAHAELGRLENTAVERQLCVALCISFLVDHLDDGPPGARQLGDIEVAGIDSWEGHDGGRADAAHPVGQSAGGRMVGLVAEVARRIAEAARRARLAAQEQFVVQPVLAVDIEVPRLRRRAGASDAVNETGRDAVRIGEVSRDQRIAANGEVGRDVTAFEHRLRIGDEAVVEVDRRHMGIEAIDIQRQRAHRLPLDIEHCAVAHPLLGEQTGVDELRIPDTQQLRMSSDNGIRFRCRLAVGIENGCAVCVQGRDRVADLRITQKLLPVAPLMARLGKHLEQQARVAGLVLPVEQRIDLRIGLLRERRMDQLRRDLGGERLLEAQRRARLDVDGARDTAFDQIGLRALVYRDLADDFRRQQRIAHAAAHRLGLVQHEPVARAHRVAVDQRLGQARARAADADPVVLREAAFAAGARADVDAWNALDRIGDVLVGQLADVFGGDHFDDRIGIALLVQRLLARRTDAGHRHRLELRRLARLRLGLLRLHCADRAQQGQRGGRGDRGRMRFHGLSSRVTAPIGMQCLRPNHSKMYRCHRVDLPKVGNSTQALR